MFDQLIKKISSKRWSDLHAYKHDWKKGTWGGESLMDRNRERCLPWGKGNSGDSCTPETWNTGLTPPTGYHRSQSWWRGVGDNRRSTAISWNGGGGGVIGTFFESLHLSGKTGLSSPYTDNIAVTSTTYTATTSTNVMTHSHTNITALTLMLQLVLLQLTTLPQDLCTLPYYY